MFNIREARPDDMAVIMTVMEAAKQIMRQSGNMHQWGDGYPSEAVIAADMEKKGGFVVEDDGRVVGYFAFLPSPEPTYARIYEGEWLDDERPYHVVHRIASRPDVHGIFSSIMDYCFSHCTNVRIDTHRDNKIMQHNIIKHGFSYCGIIYLDSPTGQKSKVKASLMPQTSDLRLSLRLADKEAQERLAYQRIVSLVSINSCNSSGSTAE